MADLTTLRLALDEIDAQLVRLYEKRMQVCKEVGRWKVGTGKPVFDEQREKEKLQSVAAMVSDETCKKGIQELFEQLMSISRKMQYQEMVAAGIVGQTSYKKVEQIPVAQAKIVYQGTCGAYGQEAMVQFFGSDCDGFGVATFPEAMCALQEGRADYAVLPIENSTAGSVHEMYDLLVAFDHAIVGEVIIPVQHVLAGCKGATLDCISTVYSKDIALAQTSQFLQSHPHWKQIPMTNTALAAKEVMLQGDASFAAVCSAYAAKVHNLSILATQINNEADNFTRFLVIAREHFLVNGANQLSICFELPHRSGALYQVLSHFIYNDLNMTRIESRPIEGEQWSYRFFVDLEGNVEDAAVKNVLRGLQEETKKLKILGNYPSAKEGSTH
jgi:chorismate mutase/prephenate dehydratase